MEGGLTEAVLEMLKGHFFIQGRWFLNDKVALICDSDMTLTLMQTRTRNSSRSLNERKPLHPIVH